jgi:hypothetical protein
MSNNIWDFVALDDLWCDAQPLHNFSSQFGHQLFPSVMFPCSWQGSQLLFVSIGYYSIHWNSRNMTKYLDSIFLSRFCSISSANFAAFVYYICEVVSSFSFNEIHWGKTNNLRAKKTNVPKQDSHNRLRACDLITHFQW